MFCFTSKKKMFTEYAAQLRIQIRLFRAVCEKCVRFGITSGYQCILSPEIHAGSGADLSRQTTHYAAAQLMLEIV